MSKIQQNRQYSKIHWLLPLILLLAMLLKSPEVARAHEQPSATCQDVEIIFAHGAATDLTDSKDVSAWRDTLTKDFSKTNLKISYYFLGETAYHGARYVGADIGIGSLKSAKNTIETFFFAGKSGEFKDSVKAGINELSGHIQETLTNCPETKFIFGGYSEGAYILHQFFNEQAKSLGLTPEKVIYIATFGDPKLYLPEGEGASPPACKNEAFSNYRIYAPNCRTHSGILGAEQPNYFPPEYIDRVGLWCTGKDIMCSNYFNLFSISDSINDHLSYADHDPFPYKQAAILIRQRLAKQFPDKITAGEETVHSVARDTAILIDTTGSMSSTINKYKSEALKIAKNTTKNGGKIALFEYRDLKTDGKKFVPRKLCDFSCTYAEFVEKIENIETSGGGDTPESVLSASLGVMNALKWHKGATKSIVLLTDATYHDTDFDGVTLADVVKRSLEIDPVNFYIIAPSLLSSDYSALATQTGGKVFDLSARDIALSGETLLNRPSLNFQYESYELTTNTLASFFVDTSAPSVDHFEWDLDLDGLFEISTTSPNISYLYTHPTSGFIQAKVVTSSGLFSTASALLIATSTEVTDSVPAINHLEITPSTDSVKVLLTTDAEKCIVILDDYILGLTGKTEFTIKDLSLGSHALTIIPISKTGLRGESTTKSFSVDSLTVSNTEKSTHTLAVSTAKKSIRPTLPKAPNTGLPTR